MTRPRRAFAPIPTPFPQREAAERAERVELVDGLGLHDEVHSTAIDGRADGTGYALRAEPMLTEFDADPDYRAAVASKPSLAERERAIIAFERQWWRNAGAKEQAIRDTFGISATRYYQLLNSLLDNPIALAFDPMVVKRLRRLRSSRATRRLAR